MLAASVYAGKRLFVKQAGETVLGGYFFHQLHSELVMVGSDICRRIDRRKLVLCGCDLVVLGFCKHAQFPQFLVQLGHIRFYPRLYGSEIMVLKFLAFRRLCAEERAARVDKVLTLPEQLFVHKEVLLFRTDRRVHALCVASAEKF